MDNPSLSEPLLLLATIWVSSAPVLAANKILHEQRDLVLGVSDLSHLPPDRAYRVRCTSLRNSYIPLLFGVLLFLALMTCFILLTASNIKLPPEHQPHRWFCYLVAAMPGFMFVGFLVGGLRDVFDMRQALREDHLRLPIDSQKTAESAPAPSDC